MATDDIRISINESDNSKMCTPSSNKTGLQIFVSSNFNTHTKVEVIEGELGNIIRKPRTKSEMSVDSIDWSFYKVPYPLRQVNEKAYEPNVISIGPYHHGKKHLETMEVIKRNCFSRMIEESNAKPEKFFRVMKELEKEFRKCYEEPLDCFDSDTFLEMMLFDGCFIVLLFQKNDYLRKSLGKLKKGIREEIYCDLLLLENQLPFLVLSKLYGVINTYAKFDDFPRLALFQFSTAQIPGSGICLPKKFPKPENIKHLLSLVHRSWLPKSHDVVSKTKETKAQRLWKSICCGSHDVEAKKKETKPQRLWKSICCGTGPALRQGGEGNGPGPQKFDNFSVQGQLCCGTEQEKKGKRKFIRCATELEEAGIDFVNKGKASLFDINFTGKLKIPTLSVEVNTERILRNFMAYEQFPESSKPTYVSDYVKLMDNLINSGKDVQLLCEHGIIDNWLGDDKVVAQMFNKLRDFTYSSIDSDDFYYAEIFDKVNDHCKRRRNKWKAYLKKKYCNTPWSTISLIAASFLLILTALQTIFSVLSFVHYK